MSLDTIVTIMCIIGAVVCWIGYQLADKYVYATYKEQKIPFNGKEIKK